MVTLSQTTAKSDLLIKTFLQTGTCLWLFELGSLLPVLICVVREALINFYLERIGVGVNFNII